jgi:hypothetical protein
MTRLDGTKVLVVDDEAFTRKTIRAALRAVGRFVVTEADDGDSVRCLEATHQRLPDQTDFANATWRTTANRPCHAPGDPGRRGFLKTRMTGGLPGDSQLGKSAAHDPSTRRTL